MSCAALLADGVTESDVYWLDPDGEGAIAPFEAFCEQVDDGGGWALVFRATNAGGVAENGIVDTADALGATPITPTSTGLHKLSDDVVAALRSGDVANDLRVDITYDGALLGRSWHPSDCVLVTSQNAAAEARCNASTRTGRDATDYTQSAHQGVLSRWYVDAELGYILSGATDWGLHIGPVSGGTDHGGSTPSPYCTWYDHRLCPAASAFELWAR